MNTVLQNKELSEVFQQLGFSDKDQVVYVALLASKPTTITPLARLVRFPPTTVQSVLSRLQKEGVVQVSKRKSRHVYEAYDPSVLKKILERKLEEVVHIIPLLKKIKNEGEVGARVSVFYRERMADIFYQALECKQKVVYEIVAAKELQEILGERFHFTKRRVEKKIAIKSLRVESREIKKYSRAVHIKELREAKFLPRELMFEATILFWDNTVALFTTKSEGLAVVVESTVLRETVQQIFNLLWSVSRTMETLVEKK
jgi:sugar-specific transcriptional regulator TrmB